MKDKDKTHKQLITELTQLRQRIAELESTGLKRNQFEESLRTERDKAQQYLDIAEVMLVVLDKKGTITLINRKGNQILGYKEGELLGKNWFTTCLPTYLRKDVKGVFKKLMAGEGKQTEFYDNPVKTKSGTERIIAWHNTVLHDAQGNIIGTLSSGEDITERKRVEEEIEKLASFPNLNPMPIVEVDQKVQPTYTNPAAQHIFPDLNKKQVKHPFLDGLKSYFSELQKTRQKYLFREIEVDSSWYSQIISLADPEYIRIYAIDITKRKRAEDTLRETSLFLRSILDSSSSISIIFTDFEQNILFWNKGAENIFGYKPEEVVDRHTIDILYPDEGDTKQTVEEIRSYILNQKRGLRRELKEVTKDKRILWISLTSTPRFDEHGNVIGILGIGEDITERKQAQEALRESEKRFRKVVETMEVGLGTIDENGVLTYVNEYLAKMLGYTIDEMIGRSTLDFYYDEESRKIQEEVFKKRWKGMGDPTPYEVTWRSKDNKKVHSILSPTPIFDADGHYTGSFAIHTDITERKRMEEALRKSEEKFRTFMETASDLMHISDKDLNFTYVNQAMARTLGYSKEEMIGMNIAQVLKKEITQNDLKRNVEKLIKKGELIFETVRVAKDGTEIQGELKNVAIFDNDGMFSGTGGVFRDITERKQIEQELRESEEKYRELINGMDDTAWVIDFDGKFIDINKAAVEVLGYSRKELLAMRPNDIDSSLDAEKITGLIKGMGTDKLQVFETTHTTKNGKKIPVEIKSTLITYKGQQAILSIARDITERKRAEEALRESAEQYRILTNTAMDGFLKLDQEGHILDVNRAYCDFLDYSKEELLKMTIADIEAIETPDKVKKHMKKVMEVGSDRFESRLRHKDGRIIDIEASSTYSPQTGNLLIFHRDISDRKRAEHELHRSYQQMQEMLVTTVNALASTVEMKDQYTAGHQPRVTQLACAIAEEMGLPEEQRNGIRMAGLVHDIGKIMVPAEILNKPGPLTEIQYEMVKMHPQASYDILKGIKFPWPVAHIVLQHHELMDGSGYPEGLSGNEILLEARILTVANVVEAMISHRPYRAAYDIKEALAEISKNKGILYDPVVVDACLKLFDEKRFAFDELL
jgi:PAS domain S-box-containing protein